MTVLEQTETTVQAILKKLETLERTREGAGETEQGIACWPVQQITEKVCRDCQRMLPLDAYEWNPWKGKPTRTVRCKECLTARRASQPQPWREEPATVRQIWKLQQLELGSAGVEGMTKGEACDLIEAGIARGTAKHGRATRRTDR